MFFLNPSLSILHIYLVTRSINDNSSYRQPSVAKPAVDIIDNRQLLKQVHTMWAINKERESILMELVGGGSVINGAYPVEFHVGTFLLLMIHPSHFFLLSRKAATHDFWIPDFCSVHSGDSDLLTPPTSISYLISIYIYVNYHNSTHIYILPVYPYVR